ncbi:MAG: hypothetical protein ACM3YN_03850 [Parcubacteria group bacterium]
MADTPQGKTRSNWWILGLVALVVLAAVIFFYARNGEERGGSLSAGQTTGAPPAQSQNP